MLSTRIQNSRLLSQLSSSNVASDIRRAVCYGEALCSGVVYRVRDTAIEIVADDAPDSLDGALRIERLANTTSHTRQGLTLVHFTAQLEPCLTHKNTLHTLNTP
jgi:hypothetical protein